MTSRHNNGRRRSYGPRMHEVAQIDRDGGRTHHVSPKDHHAAIPTHDTGAIAIGTEDACLRCEGAIVVTLTGWEHVG